MKKKQKTKSIQNRSKSPHKPVIDETENVENKKASRKISWEFIVSLITSLTAIASIIVSIITVSQMKADRDASYRPKILVNTVQCDISWDETGKCDWMNYLSNLDTAEESEEGEGDPHEGIVTAPIGVLLKTVNVGVGTAKHIYFEWHESNIFKLNEYLIQCDESKNGFMEIDEDIKIIYDNKILGMSKPSITAQMYMLPMASETYDIVFPPAYYLLIQEIIKSGGNTEDIPYIILTATYTDIQGKEYTDIFLFAVKIILRVEDASGAGKATFQLVPLFEAP